MGKLTGSLLEELYQQIRQMSDRGAFVSRRTVLLPATTKIVATIEHGM